MAEHACMNQGEICGFTQLNVMQNHHTHSSKELYYLQFKQIIKITENIKMMGRILENKKLQNYVLSKYWKKIVLSNLLCNLEFWII